MQRITITSTFPAAAEAIWPLLARMDTLQYIAAPLAFFTPISPAGEELWQENTSMQFRLRILGFIPMGIHTIYVRRFDADSHTVYTEESNRLVPVWNHTIRLEAMGDAVTRYTDIVDIHARWRTGMVALWSRWFYRHRQRKWRRLLQQKQRESAFLA